MVWFVRTLVGVLIIAGCAYLVRPLVSQHGASAPPPLAMLTPPPKSLRPRLLPGQASPYPPLIVAVAQSLPAIVMASPHAPPQILHVDISKRELRGGETVSGHVLTSSNVASVEARVEGYSAVMAKIGVGEFVLSYKVPVIPAFLHGNYAMDIIARNVDGMRAVRKLPVTVQ